MWFELYLTSYDVARASDLQRAAAASSGVINAARVAALVEGRADAPISLGGAADRKLLVHLEEALVEAGMQVCIIDTGGAGGVRGLFNDLAGVLRPPSPGNPSSARRVARGLVRDAIGACVVVGLASLIAVVLDGALSATKAPERPKPKSVEQRRLSSATEGESTLELATKKREPEKRAPKKKEKKGSGPPTWPVAVGFVFGFGAHRLWRRRRPMAGKRRRGDAAIVLVGAGLGAAGIALATPQAVAPPPSAPNEAAPSLVAGAAEVSTSGGGGGSGELPKARPIDPTRPFQDFVERLSEAPQDRCPKAMKRFARLACELFAQVPSATFGGQDAAAAPMVASVDGGAATVDGGPATVDASAPAEGVSPGGGDTAASRPANKGAGSATARAEGVGATPERKGGGAGTSPGSGGGGGGETARLSGSGSPGAAGSKGRPRQGPKGRKATEHRWTQHVGLGIAGVGTGVTISAGLGLVGLGALVLMVGLAPAIAQLPGDGPAAIYDPEARLQQKKAIDAAPYAEALGQRFMSCLRDEGTTLAEEDEAKLAEAAKDLGLALVRSDSGRGCTADVSAMWSCTSHVRGLSCAALHDEIRDSLAAALQERPSPSWAEDYASTIIGRIDGCYEAEAGEPIPSEASDALDTFRSLMARSLGALDGPCKLIRAQLDVCIAIAQSMTCPEIGQQLRSDPSQLIHQSMQTCGGLFECKYDFDSWQR